MSLPPGPHPLVEGPPLECGLDRKAFVSGAEYGRGGGCHAQGWDIKRLWLPSSVCSLSLSVFRLLTPGYSSHVTQKP